MDIAGNKFHVPIVHICVYRGRGTLILSAVSAHTVTGIDRARADIDQSLPRFEKISYTAQIQFAFKKEKDRLLLVVHYRPQQYEEFIRCTC